MIWKKSSVEKYIFVGLITITLLLGLSSCGKKNVKAYKQLEKEPVQTSLDVVFGNDDAENTMFLYASYNCKFCRYLFSKTFPELTSKYLDTGKLKVVLKLIYKGNDQNIKKSIKVASCVYNYGTYMPYHNLLLANPNVVQSDDFTTLVDDLMLRNEGIAKCVLSSDDSYLNESNKEFDELSLEGTPNIVMNKHAYSGYRPFSKLDELIKREFNL